MMRACKLICDHPVWPSTPVPEGCWMEALIQSRSAKLLRLFFWLATQGPFGRLKQRAAEMVKDGGPPLRHNTGER